MSISVLALFAGSLIGARGGLGQNSFQTVPPGGVAWSEDVELPSVVPASYEAVQASGAARPDVGPIPWFSETVPASHSAAAGACGCDPCWAPFAGSRWYLSISGGWQHRETVHEANDPQTFIIFDDGFAANAAIGYRFDLFRVEAEYSFMNNEVGTAGAGGLSSPAAGNVNLRALMFNLYHDVQLDLGCWRPYVGAGIGLYQSDINSLNPEFFNVAGAPFAGTAVNTTSDMPFAYQFRVGATRPLSQKTEFYTGYRYFRGEELEFAAPPFSNFAPTFHPEGAKVHAVEFGLRVNF